MTQSLQPRPTLQQYGTILEFKLTSQDRKQAQTPNSTIQTCLRIPPIRRGHHAPNYDPK